MITHAERFSQSQKRLALYAKALAHPARVAILRRLATADICDCAQIVDDLPLSQSTVSQHLKVLKEAGLVTMCTDGPRSCYSLNQEALTEHSDLITAFLQSLIGSCGCRADSDRGETLR